MSKLKVLALCGFTQNAFIYSKQLGAVRKSCKDVDFVFLEPPIVVEKADMPWNSSASDFDSEATTEKEEQTAETTPRAWYLSTGDKQVYRGYEETLKYIHDYMVEHGPFDGVMGFSQGACVAATLAALCDQPGVHPFWPADPPIPKLKFLIAVGGFYPASRDPSFSSVFPIASSLPTLHIMGRGDVVVPPERSMTLVEQCKNARVEYHDGGHFTPSKASWRHFFNAYISSFVEGGSQGDVPAVHSFGPSGTSTPATPRSSSPAGGSRSRI